MTDAKGPAMPGPELQALAACLSGSGLAEDSPQIAEFEMRLASLAGLEQPGLATTSASAAMQLALTGLEIKAGECVVLSTLCEIRFVNPVIHLGIRPLLLDVEPTGLSLDPEALATFLDSQCLRRGSAWFERESGRRVAAVVLPHIGGLRPRRRDVLELCHRHGLALIELPESLRDAELASSAADARVLDFSHHEPGLGGGGALLSPHASVIQSARWWAGLCRSVGDQGPSDFGFQYRMPALLAALGNARLERIESEHSTQSQSHGLPTTLLPFGPAVFAHHARRAWRIPEGSSFAACLENLFPAGWTGERLPLPLHRQELYAGFLSGSAPVAERAWQETLVARPVRPVARAPHLSVHESRSLVESGGRSPL